jgi:hypothetical protein
VLLDFFCALCPMLLVSLDCPTDNPTKINVILQESRMYMVAYGNFVNKEFSIVIIIFTCKSLATTLPVYISENEQGRQEKSITLLVLKIVSSITVMWSEFYSHINMTVLAKWPKIYRVMIDSYNYFHLQVTGDHTSGIYFRKWKSIDKRRAKSKTVCKQCLPRK